MCSKKSELIISIFSLKILKMKMRVFACIPPPCPLPPITDDLVGVGNKDHARMHCCVLGFAFHVRIPGT